MSEPENTFTMRAPDDFHVHLRNGEMLRNIIRYSASHFARALVMPNTDPPILTPSDVLAYRSEIWHNTQGSQFEPLMTIQITEQTTPEIIQGAMFAGAIAGKVYPRGMTTNSENGVENYNALWDTLKAMEGCGMILSLHGESPEPDLFCLDREKAFLDTLVKIVYSFPRLKVVLEHVTTQDAIECICKLPKNVAATITVHHLFITLNDVIGGKLNPHHFCKPVAKRNRDKTALLLAATSGNPKFFLGTDSAPHPKEAKECGSGCAGIFTAPVAIPLLFRLFSENERVDVLEDFCSSFGADFYGIERTQRTISLVKESWEVPKIIAGVVPFFAGKTLEWKVST